MLMKLLPSIVQEMNRPRFNYILLIPLIFSPFCGTCTHLTYEQKRGHLRRCDLDLNSDFPDMFRMGFVIRVTWPLHLDFSLEDYIVAPKCEVL